MKDDVLNSFIDKLLKENIEKEKFEQYIDMFSRFLGYTNPDYKYNGTYLSQYVNDFMQVYQMLKKKNEKYHEIFMALIKIGKNFEIVIDQVFYGVFLKPEVKCEYSGINKIKIVSKTIEIRIKFESDENEYIFCKEYGDFEESELVDGICSYVKKIYKNNEE